MILLSGYQAEEQIYSGANAIIYRGHRKNDKVPVVIKKLNKQYPTQEELARFKREFEIIQTFNSDGIVRAYSLEKYQNTLVMILEDFNGNSFEKLLPKWTFDLAEFLRISIKLAEIIGQIHQKNIIHKNINPGNIIWNPQTGQVKITDFGISTELFRETPEALDQKIIEGTLPYISPEQTGRMNRNLDFRTDFYSLGVTLYEIATRCLPFESEDPMTLIHAHIARIPVSPRELNPQIPAMISKIILKLMAKTAEGRYQSAFGLKSDLQECLAQLTRNGRIKNFEIGKNDISSRFQIPQKLYGRENEIETSLKIFNRVIQGDKAMLLVAGQPGVGKTAVANEVQKKIIEKQGYFIYGKFDQFQRNIPYSGLIQPFQELMQKIAAGGEKHVSFWKTKILQSLGQNGQVLTEVIPELELIIGKQPKIFSLPPADAQIRFNHTFLNFIRTFSKNNYIITIFIDDLQWADNASLMLIELIMSDPQMNFLFFIGTYRDNEVNEAHALRLIVYNLIDLKVSTSTIFLKPLEKHHINQLLSETLACDPLKSEPLAELCFEKTQGNPFFLNQLLESMHENKQINFDSNSGFWKWDVEKIRRVDITDNVVELMMDKIQKLPKKTQSIVLLAACIGTQFDLLTLSMVDQLSLKETAEELWIALNEGLIIPINDSYKFIEIIDQELKTSNTAIIPPHLIPTYKFQHDRIQQAAYALVPETEQQIIHLKIGRLLLKHTLKSAQKEKIFDIINQLNSGANTIKNPQERIEVAQLNLKAGKKAKASAAFKQALNYYKAGISLLPERKWIEQYELTFNLYLEATESAFLCTDFDDMEKLAKLTLHNAVLLLDKVKIHDLKIQYYYAQNQLLKVVNEGLNVLKLLGYRFPEAPNNLQVLLKLLKTKVALIGKKIDNLINLKDMIDPERMAAARIMLSLSHAVYGARPKLTPMLGFEGIALSLKHGVAPETPAGFAGFGLLLIGILDDIDNGYRFGKLALSLNDRDCTKYFRSHTIFIVSGMIDHWKKPLQKTLPALLTANQLGMEVGDFEYATLSAFFYGTYSFFSGSPLEPLSREMTAYSATIREYKQDTHFYFNEMARQTVLNLMGNSDDPCKLIGDAYNEEEMLPVHYQNNDTSAIHMLSLYKLKLTYHFGHYQEAFENSKTLKKNLEGMISTAYIPLFHFYDALLRLSSFSKANKKEKKRHLKIIKSHQKKLKKWAHHAPMNHLHKWTLVEAERHRVLGEDTKAAELYDQAIALAKEHEYLQEEALGNELAAKFRLTCGNTRLAEDYMTKAVYCYSLWGAKAKVDYLHKTWPQLTARTNKSNARTQTGVDPKLSLHTAESLDLQSVIKASQAISGEIVLDKLMKKMITVLIENAGAQKALLLSEYDNQWKIEAQGTVSKDGITALTEFKTAGPSDVPHSIIHYCAKNQKNIVIDNAAQEIAFNQDIYIKTCQPLSILCTPIFHQGKLANILYLENNLMPGAFTPDRLTLIQLLSSQAAISLQNASLYYRLQASEKKYRDIFENAVEGIFQISTDGRFISANQSMADILGYDSPAALMALTGNMKYQFFSDHAAREQFVKEFREKGQVTGLEIGGIRKDNREFWGSLSLRAVYDSNRKIIYYEGSVTDITEHKKMEQAEREAQTAKAAAKAKDEFLANMSHEIRTPMTTIVGMTKLAMETELTTSQHDYLKNIKTSSDSLLHIIDDILNFSKIEAGKLEIEVIEFCLNDIIDKISYMFSSTLTEKEIEFIFSISNEIPDILLGDPLKISQVLINLISNAIKFTDKGEILLRIEPVEKDKNSVTLRFFVKDTGIGIAKEHIDKLFDSFTQADGSITRKFGGTGLGLAICKNIIELMNGRIWVESIEGQGSTFYFEIVCKLKKPYRKKTKTDASFENYNFAKGIQILLVEDNRINQQIAVEIMESSGLHVDVADNGEQAVESVKQKSYDAVLMDLQMPVMDGYAATRLIRKDHRNKNLPIIAMTAHCLEESKENCLQAGMNDFIVKPFEANALMSILSKYAAQDRAVPAEDEKEKNNKLKDGISYVFPDVLPGLNIKSGISRLGGKENLYLKVIFEFYNDYRDIAEKIQYEIKNKNTEFVKRTAHTLKSLAGNIGAKKLQHAARIIEVEASKGLDAFDEQVIDRLKKNLDPVITSIKQLLNEHC